MLFDKETKEKGRTEERHPQQFSKTSTTRDFIEQDNGNKSSAARWGSPEEKREMDSRDVEKPKCGSSNYKVHAFLHSSLMQQWKLRTRNLHAHSSPPEKNNPHSQSSITPLDSN